MERLKLKLTNKDYFYLSLILFIFTFRIDVSFNFGPQEPIVEKKVELGSFPIHKQNASASLITPTVYDNTEVEITTADIKESAPKPVVKKAPPAPEKKVVEDAAFTSVVKHLAASDPKAAGYVSRFYSVAKEEEKQFGIPTSITLAQGMKETDRGGSYLAIHANNHFGIKFYRMSLIPEGLRKYVVEPGYVIRHDDCKRRHYWSSTEHKGHMIVTRTASKFLLCPNPDKFVKYDRAWASYRHHSYIVMKKRYTQHNPKKYNDWAYALKKGGYATSPTYHTDLIRDISKYKLQELDN